MYGLKLTKILIIINDAVANGEMTMDEVIVRVAGAAGDGVQSAGQIVAKAFSRSGLNSTTYNYYQDIIRGGQSWYQIRASASPVRSQGDGLDILIALNKDGVERHINPEINEGGANPLSNSGIAIFDESIKDFPDHGQIYCPVPLSDIASKYSKVALLKNTVAIGAAMAAIGVDFEILSEVIRDTFGSKGNVAEQNVNAAKEGYEYYLKKYKKLAIKLDYNKRKRYFIGGGEAVGLGFVAGGLKFYAGYPMTPASSALHYLTSHAREFDIAVKIPEDEISAVNMAVGANYAGVRSATGSSGGGFSLMVETVGLSGMMEIPLVIYEAQRAGPSTGLPTKTEQADLNLVLGSGQGDFLKIILTPRNVEECFVLSREAMNLAEKYQTPVFILTDLYLSEHYETTNDLNLDFKIDRGKRAPDNQENFKRYLDTADGISPRGFPGQPGLMHNEDSDEHNEYGDVVSDAVTDPKDRIAMMNKRMRKFETYLKNMPPTPTYRYEDAEYAVIQWGSTAGVVEEAVDLLREKGIKVGLIEINRAFPLNRDIKGLIKGKKKLIFVENNFTGQFERLFRSEFLVETDSVRKYDGENFYPGQLAREIEGVIKR